MRIGFTYGFDPSTSLMAPMQYTVRCDVCGEVGTDHKSARQWAERHVAEKHMPEVELVDVGFLDSTESSPSLFGEAVAEEAPAEPD